MELKDYLLQHVYYLSETIGPRNRDHYANLQAAACYVADQLEANGYTVEWQSYAVPCGRGSASLPDAEVCEVHNVIATKRGHTASDQILVVGAHYDSCDNPGADDNASGVAGLLEIARLLASVPSKKSIQFVAFVNEEPPFFHTSLMGSRVFANRAKQQNIAIQGALILEMLGFYSQQFGSQHVPPLLRHAFPDQGNFIMAVGDAASKPLLDQLQTGFNQHSAVPMLTNTGYEQIIQQVTGFDFSDHWSFWQEGYPAVMITDTAFLRNPHYHQDTDRYATLDYEKMAEIVKNIAAVLQTILKTIN